MNEHPSQLWSALLCELEQYENALMNQDGHVALVKFKSAASLVGYDDVFDISAMQFLYKLHGRNVTYITPDEIRRVSKEMEETIPTNPSALHVGDEAKAKEIQWLMNITGTKNILAMHLELKKYEDGIHPLSLKTDVAHLVEMILSSNIPINGATVLDAFAGIGWMDVPLMLCGANRVIHIDYQIENKLTYEALMIKRGKEPYPYLVADFFSLNPLVFRDLGIQGITAHLPWLDNATNSNAFPLTDAFIGFADTVLPDDGWILTTLDSQDIAMVQRVAKTYDFISSQHDNTLVLQRQ